MQKGGAEQDEDNAGASEGPSGEPADSPWLCCVERSASSDLGHLGQIPAWRVGVCVCARTHVLCGLIRDITLNSLSFPKAQG